MAERGITKYYVVSLHVCSFTYKLVWVNDIAAIPNISNVKYAFIVDVVRTRYNYMCMYEYIS